MEFFVLITIARIAILPVMRIHSEKIAAWLGLTPNNHNMEAPESTERPFIARDDESIGVSAQPRCLSLDLEVGKADGRIRAFGAVRADTGERLAHSGGDLAAAKLDDLFAGLRGARRAKGANRRNRRGARPNRHWTGGRAVPARSEGR